MDLCNFYGQVQDKNGASVSKQFNKVFGIYLSNPLFKLRTVNISVRVLSERDNIKHLSKYVEALYWSVIVSWSYSFLTYYD